MKTHIIKIKNNTIPKARFNEVVKTLKNGEPVVFPTDTVYGIGVSAFNYKGIKKIYQLKKRDFQKPLVWLIDSSVNIEKLVEEVTQSARMLMDHFWPGPLTLIFKASWIAALGDTKQGSLGLRVPKHTLVRNLIKQAGVPLATTSANKSGEVSPTRPSQLKVFSGKIPFILDGGILKSENVSTVVDVAVTPPLILREGAISKEKIAHVLRI